MLSIISASFIVRRYRHTAMYFPTGVEQPNLVVSFCGTGPWIMSLMLSSTVGKSFICILT